MILYCLYLNKYVKNKVKTINQLFQRKIRRKREHQDFNNKKDGISSTKSPERQLQQQSSTFCTTDTESTASATTDRSPNCPNELANYRRPITCTLASFNVENIFTSAAYVSKLLKEVDILAIQEHWLWNFEKSIFRKICC